MTQSGYAVEYVVDNFLALLHDANFPQELAILKVGKFQFLRRRQLLLEFRALYIGLWRLALARSLPLEGEDIFAAFLTTYPQQHRDAASQRLLARGQQYAEILLSEGDRDYTHISQHILSFSVLEEKDRKAQNLRLALSIRRLYGFIFSRLI
ncbi:MAG: hypothetical protein RRY29_08635 [Desulfovibrionaceae bacterium]